MMSLDPFLEDIDYGPISSGGGLVGTNFDSKDIDSHNDDDADNEGAYDNLYKGSSRTRLDSYDHS
jgi:hypothetical protein